MTQNETLIRLPPIEEFSSNIISQDLQLKHVKNSFLNWELNTVQYFNQKCLNLALRKKIQFFSFCSGPWVLFLLGAALIIYSSIFNRFDLFFQVLGMYRSMFSIVYHYKTDN